MPVYKVVCELENTRYVRDETAEAAERLVEEATLEALFQDGLWCEATEITPADPEYTEACEDAWVEGEDNV